MFLIFAPPPPPAAMIMPYVPRLFSPALMLTLSFCFSAAFCRGRRAFLYFSQHSFRFSMLSALFRLRASRRASFSQSRICFAMIIVIALTDSFTPPFHIFAHTADSQASALYAESR